MAKKLRKPVDHDQQVDEFRGRVENLGGEVVRYDAPRGWVDELIDETGLNLFSTDEEISEAATAWAQETGCYADPEGEE